MAPSVQASGMHRRDCTQRLDRPEPDGGGHLSPTADETRRLSYRTLFPTIFQLSIFNFPEGFGDFDFGLVLTMVPADSSSRLCQTGPS